MKAVLMNGPCRAQIGKLTEIPMSGPFSIRRAIKEARPDPQLVKDVLLPPPKPPSKSKLESVVSQLALAATSIVGAKDRGIQINHKTESKFGFVAFTLIMQVISLQQAYGYSSVLLPAEPRKQRKARRRTDAAEWIRAEFVEMDTVYNMGTIVYVPMCQVLGGTTLIPCKFAYKCKFSDC